MITEASMVSLHGKVSVVGRDAQLKNLFAIANGLSQTGGRLVVVTGERGVGKTTLLKEFDALLKRNKVEIPFVIATCPAGIGKEISFLPFRMLSEFAQGGKSIDHRFAFDLASAALACIPLVGPFLVLGSVPIRKMVETMYHKDEKDRDVVFRQSADRLIDASKKGPVVLAIDDVQWIDLSSLFLIELISRRIEQSKLLVILILSEQEAKQSGVLNNLADALAHLDKSIHSQMELRNLQSSEIEALLEIEFPNNQFTPELSNWLIRHTGGNPYLIVESLQHLLVREVLHQQNGTWSLRGEIPVDVPRSIEEFVTSQLDVLVPEYLTILESASTIGQEFDSTLLADLLSVDRNQLARSLQVLCKRYHIIEPKSPIRVRNRMIFGYCFRDEHTKRVLYDGIQDEARCLLHKRVAELLESRSNSLQLSDADQLSFHLERAAEYERTLECSKRYAIVAQSRCAFGEAVKFFQRALRCLAHMEESALDEYDRGRVLEETVAVLFQQAVAYRLQRAWQDSISCLDKCLEVFAKLNKESIVPLGEFDGVSTAEIFEEFGYVFCGMRDWDKAKEHFDKCVLAIQKIHLAKKFNHIAWEYALASRYLEEAVGLIDETIRLRHLPYDYGVRGWIRFQLKNYESALEDVMRARDGIQRSNPNDIGAINVDNFHIGFIYFGMGRLEEARKQLRLALDEYERNRERLKYDKNAPDDEKVALAIEIVKQLDAQQTTG